MRLFIFVSLLLSFFGSISATASNVEPTAIEHISAPPSNSDFASYDTPDWVTPFVGMNGYIIGFDIVPWQVTAVNSGAQTATVLVGTGLSAWFANNVPFEYFDEDPEKGYIITDDIMP